jgi:3-dehydroquinate dehydratase II
MKLLILNGPNLNLLGQRNVQIYGTESFEQFFSSLKTQFPSIIIEYKQSNVEGELINMLQTTDAQGVIFNAGAYTHTSVALRDCIEAINVPVVEVHISNITARESFRHESMITPVCKGSILGFGLQSYTLAIHYFNELFIQKQN